MGLDQYLFKKKSHRKPVSDSYRDRRKEYDLNYWRKFNALQKWMTDHYCNGIDDQQDMLLDKEGINDLIEVLDKIFSYASQKGVYKKIDDSEIKPEERYFNEAPQEIQDFCNENFPAEDGFFFGNTSYDWYYFDEVRRTLEIFKELLEKWDKKYDYYYGSWW